MAEKKIKALDFFCGAGGMTCGMTMAGIEVLAGIDIDESCKETYEYNNKSSKFITANIKELTFDSLEKEVDISQNDDDMLFIGCSPCQYWSVIRTKRDKSSETKNLLGDFKKFVDHYRPGYIVIENVPGIKTNREESGLYDFIKFLEDNKYNHDYGIINSNDYGVPQSRRRFLLIASRVKIVTLPKKKRGKKAVVKGFIGIKNGFPKVDAGNIDKTAFMHSVAGLRQINLDRLNKTKINGGLRDGWADDDELQIETYKTHDGFKDVYGRMCWDTAGPTITTKFFSLSNGRFGHPDELRAISLREGATLQTFPKNYIFKEKSIAANARLIGNAVPPELSFRIGNSIL